MLFGGQFAALEDGKGHLRVLVLTPDRALGNWNSFPSWLSSCRLYEMSFSGAEELVLQWKSIGKCSTHNLIAFGFELLLLKMQGIFVFSLFLATADE